MSALAKSEVAMYRVIRGSAEFKDHAGAAHELVTGDVITAGKDALELVGVGDDTQLLRLGLMNSLERLRKWTPAQRDEVDGLAARIITQRELRPLRAEGKPVGYLYRQI
jgi:hypothetical protein